MKNTIVFACLSLAYLAVPAQKNEENKDILICNSAKSEFNVTELDTCGVLTAKDTTIKIVSFTISVLSPLQTMIEVNVKGNELNDRAKIVLESSSPEDKVYIEKVMSEKGEDLGFRRIKLISSKK